jgi:hypothetical protein
MTCGAYASKAGVIGIQHTPTAAPSATTRSRFAFTDTNLGHRVPPGLLAADNPPAPIELRQAFRVIDDYVADYLEHARVKPAAENLPRQ